MLWPNAGSQGPAKDHFYGDFGLTLKHGAMMFQQYDVVYDLENGMIGLIPVPEPSACAPLAAAALLAAPALLRKRQRD